MSRLMRSFAKKPLLGLTVLLFVVEGLAMSYFILAPSLLSAKEEASSDADTSLVEIPLGEFKVRNHQTPSDSIILKFSVCLIVAKEAQEQWETSFNRHQNRVREGIAIVARRANEKVLDEDSLPTLKRRIKVAVAGAIDPTIDSESIEVLLPDFVIQKG